MKRLFSFLFGISMAVLPALAQDSDMIFAFVNENGDILEDGATVVRNHVEAYDEDGTEVIYSGVSVKNISGTASDYLKVIYVIEQMDNGTFQICFPMTCNMKTEEGYFETAPGQLMGDLQDLQSEWFPTEDGTCIVTLFIEVLTKTPTFPPNYIHKSDGPTLTLQFVKGGSSNPIKGDVNGDKEVNIADVNEVIEAIIKADATNTAADVTEDGEVNIADVNAVIDILLK